MSDLKKSVYFLSKFNFTKNVWVYIKFVYNILFALILYFYITDLPISRRKHEDRFLKFQLRSYGIGKYLKNEALLLKLIIFFSFSYNENKAFRADKNYAFWKEPDVTRYFKCAKVMSSQQFKTNTSKSFFVTIPTVIWGYIKSYHPLTFNAIQCKWYIFPCYVWPKHSLWFWHSFFWGGGGISVFLV